SAQIREILISESAWEEMTCLFAPSLVAQAKEADKGGMNFSFINSAGQYQLEAKKYVRRIRDKVPYSDWDKEQLQDANSSWMVEDSFPRALREYNEMVDDYNSLR
ncbi:DUF3829 domain-containing protein, partial [Escherichia coli]|uniref:DUF3829 domain-containing protein n=1 Tax=Escherichia coli TaxID=562 RepID=UPI00208F51ED